LLKHLAGENVLLWLAVRSISRRRSVSRTIFLVHEILEIEGSQFYVHFLVYVVFGGVFMCNRWQRREAISWFTVDGFQSYSAHLSPDYRSIFPLARIDFLVSGYRGTVLVDFSIWVFREASRFHSIQSHSILFRGTVLVDFSIWVFRVVTKHLWEHYPGSET